MAATETDEPCRYSADQLIDIFAGRPLITCTLSSDIALSGGIPIGATVIIGGKPKMGKTTFALECAANAQNNLGSKVFFFPIEGRLTHLTLAQVKSLKTDIDNFEVVMPPAIHDKSGKLVGHKKWHGQRWWDVIGETIQNNPKSILIIDSIAAMTSESELTEGMGYQGRGDIQKLEAQFCRLFGSMIISNYVTVFLITQIQANTSGYGAKTLLKVGNSVRHQGDVILHGENFEKWKEENGRIRGQDMLYRVEASALGPPYMDIRIPLRYGEGIDRAKDVMTHAVNWEIIVREGAWYKLPFVPDVPTKLLDLAKIGKDEKPVKVQGENNVREWLIQNPKSLAQIETKIRSIIFGK